MSFTFDLTYPDVAKARRAINLVVVEKVIEIIGMMQLSAEQRSRAATLFVLRLFLRLVIYCYDYSGSRIESQQEYLSVFNAVK